MKNQSNDADWYLSDPRTRKWMIQCSFCQMIGYRADAPEQFFGRVLLIKHFKPIQLDETGACEDCRSVEFEIK